MYKPSRLRVCAALLVLFGLFAAACGQKPGVHNVSLTQGGTGAGTIPAGEEFVDADNDGVDDSTGLAADDFAVAAGAGGLDPGTTGGGAPGSGTPGSGTPGGGDGTGAGTPGGGGGGDGGGDGDGGDGDGGQPPSGQPPQGGGDSTGVTASEIRIGVHAPITGASPLPPGEFNSGKEMYWRHRGKVQGRTVRVFVEDDTYNPSTASRVCKKLIQEDKVFILVGGGGADQIRTCAIVAAQAGVPYVSAGVDEGVLRQLPNYFALSFSYPQQAPILVQYIQNVLRPGNKELGMLYDRTPSFKAALDKFESAAKSAGYSVKRVPYSGNASADGEALRGLDVVFPLMAPADFVQVAISPGGRTVGTYAGMGITMGLNSVTNPICRANGSYDGRFFSPFPGLDKIEDMDPDFREAGGQGDIELALWGLNVTIDAAFTKMGKNLYREAFLQAMTGGIKTGVYPTLNHSQSNHFGATSTHVLKSNCSSGQNDTDATFKNRF